MLQRLACGLVASILALASIEAAAYDVVDKELEGKGFHRIKVQLGGFVQPRFRFQPDDTENASPGQVGFFVHRARLQLSGEFLPDPSRRFGFGIRQNYSLELVGKNGAILEDANVDFFFGSEFQFRFGQFKAPVHRANLVSDANNLFPDRNRITQFAGLPNRDIGAMFFGWWGERRIQWELGVFNGEGQNRLPSNRKLLYVGRVVFSPWGSPGDGHELLRDWRPKGVEKYVPILSTGYSIHTFVDGTPGQEQFFLGHNAELFFHWRFLTLMSELHYRQSKWENPNIADYDQLGWYVQLGAFLHGIPWAQDHVALMGRYEEGDEFIPLTGDVPPTGPLDPAQRTRRESVGIGFYAGKPLFRFVQDLRMVVSYTFKQELEGFSVKDDELNVSLNLSF